MTKRELNKAIIKLNSELYRLSFEDRNDFLQYVSDDAKKEFVRIYGADTSMESLDKRNILVMIRLNQQYEFIPHESFGKDVKLMIG